MIKHIYKPIALAIGFFISQSWLNAQTYDADAILFSRHNYFTSARVAGVGGAFGSTGADAGSVSINPAGIGLVRGNVISLSPGFNSYNANTDFLGKSMKDNAFRMSINNLAFVFNSSGKGQSVVKGFSMGFSLNRLADFNGSVKFGNKNGLNSIIQQYWASLNYYVVDQGYSLSYDQLPFELVLANNVGVVRIPDGGTYYDMPIVDTIEQSGRILQKGSYNDMGLNAAVNINEIVFVGFGIGFPYLNFERDITFTEEDVDDLNPGFDKLTVKNSYSTNGVGLNGNIGIIVKPSRLFRAGIAFKTPTMLSLTENYSASMDYQSDSSFTTDASPTGEFQYSLVQPFRLNVGLTGFLNKYGFISADYELVNYKSNKYNFGTNNTDFADSYNELIKSKYRVSHNIRIGVELAYKNFRLRGGYAYNFSPFKSGVAVSDSIDTGFKLQQKYDLSQHNFTAGFGYVYKRFSFDIAYVNSRTKYYYAPYISVGSYLLDYPEDGAKTTAVSHHFLVGVSYKFGKKKTSDNSIQEIAD